VEREREWESLERRWEREERRERMRRYWDGFM